MVEYCHLRETVPPGITTHVPSVTVRVTFCPTLLVVSVSVGCADSQGSCAVLVPPSVASPGPVRLTWLATAPAASCGISVPRLDPVRVIT